MTYGMADAYVAGLSPADNSHIRPAYGSSVNPHEDLTLAGHGTGYFPQLQLLRSFEDQGAHVLMVGHV
jgi:hypothetical protein